MHSDNKQEGLQGSFFVLRCLEILILNTQKAKCEYLEPFQKNTGMCCRYPRYLKRTWKFAMFQ